MPITPNPAPRAAGGVSADPGQVVLLGLDEQQVVSWSASSHALEMRCAIAASLDECAAHALGAAPTVYVTAEACFEPRMVSLADTAFRRTTLVLLTDSREHLAFWRMLAWEALPTDATREGIMSPLRAARDEAARRLDEWMLIEDVRRRQSTLGAQERQVLEAICAGRLNKQIASEQSVSVRTVEQRRRRVFEKMGVDSAVPLAAMMAVFQMLEDQSQRARTFAAPHVAPTSAGPPKPNLPIELLAKGEDRKANATTS